MRLVPHQNSDKITELFKNYFESIAPKSVKVKVTAHHGGEPVVVPITSKGFLAASKAMEETYGKKPVPTRGGGSIVNIGSIAWKMADGSAPLYVACKAAITGLTRALAREFGAQGTRVNTVLPGWVMTDRQRALWVDAAAEAQIDAAQCLPGRLNEADIAAMVLWLASDQSRMCTAQEFTVDGGWV